MKKPSRHYFFIFIFSGIFFLLLPIAPHALKAENTSRKISSTAPLSNEWLAKIAALSEEFKTHYKAYVFIRDQEAKGASQEQFEQTLAKNNFSFSAIVQNRIELNNAPSLLAQLGVANSDDSLSALDTRLQAHVRFYALQMENLLLHLQAIDTQNPGMRNSNAALNMSGEEVTYLQAVILLDIAKMLVILGGVENKAKPLGCKAANNSEALLPQGFSRSKNERLLSEQLRLKSDVYSTQAACKGFPKNIQYFTGSRRTFNQALKEFPLNYKAVISKGLYYYFPPKFFGGNARKAIVELLPVAKNGNDYEKYLANAWISQAYFKLKETKKSADAYAKAKSIYPNGLLLQYINEANAENEALEY